MDWYPPDPFADPKNWLNSAYLATKAGFYRHNADFAHIRRSRRVSQLHHRYLVLAYKGPRYCGNYGKLLDCRAFQIFGLIRLISQAQCKPMASTKKKVKVDLIHGVKPHRPKRGERYMGELQVAHFREILNAWKNELIDDSERTVTVMQDETVNLPDPNDRATQETDRSLELRTRDRERKLVKKINESLADLDTSDYGRCEECGVDIGIKRLEARPTATLCIDCKSLSEIREKQNA